MKRFSIIFLLLAFLTTQFSFDTKAQNYPFEGGEQLTYKLRYKWGVINADVANLNFNIKEETYKGEPCFRLVTRGATSNLAASLVKVNYFYDSRFSIENLTPLAFSREQTEGSYWAKNEYTWSDAGRRLHAIVDKSTRPLRDTVFTSATSTIYDVISTLYAVRAADLDAVKKGRKLHFVAALDCNVYDLNVSYVTTEDRKVPDLGIIKADKYKLTFRTREGGEQLDKESAIAISSKGEGNLVPIYLWITPDESRTVVYFSASIAVGSIVGRLVKAEGTKVPVIQMIR